MLTGAEQHRPTAAANSVTIHQCNDDAISSRVTESAWIVYTWVTWHFPSLHANKDGMCISCILEKGLVKKLLRPIGGRPPLLPPPLNPPLGLNKSIHLSDLAYAASRRSVTRSHKPWRTSSVPDRVWLTWAADRNCSSTCDLARTRAWTLSSTWTECAGCMPCPAPCCWGWTFQWRTRSSSPPTRWELSQSLHQPSRRYFLPVRHIRSLLWI